MRRWGSDGFEILFSLWLISVVLAVIIYFYNRWRRKRKIHEWARCKTYSINRLHAEGLAFWILLYWTGFLWLPVLILSKLTGSWLRQSWRVVLQDENGGHREASIYFGYCETLGERYGDMDIRWK